MNCDGGGAWCERGTGDENRLGREDKDGQVIRAGYCCISRLNDCSCLRRD
jgi:hypothetical protein